MTKKDYIAIAHAIRDTGGSVPLVEALCVVFHEDNDRFDRERFLRECGY